MHLFMMITLCAVFLYPSVQGIYFRNFRREPESTQHYDFEDTSEEIQNDTLDILNGSSETTENALESKTDEQRLESTSDMLPSESIMTVESNSTSTSSLPVLSTKIAPNTQSSQLEITLTEIFSNESNSTGSVSQFSGTPSSSTGQTKSSNKTTSLSTSTNEGIIVSSTEDEEQEGVVRGQPSSPENTFTTTSKPETVYQKALALINDTYVLSILLPVAAGVIFASTILVTIATCRCFRRQCRRRRLRKKTLPDSVKHFRPSDRARLLAESSEEEF